MQSAIQMILVHLHIYKSSADYGVWKVDDGMGKVFCHAVVLIHNLFRIRNVQERYRDGMWERSEADFG